MIPLPLLLAGIGALGGTAIGEHNDEPLKGAAIGAGVGAGAGFAGPAIFGAGGTSAAAAPSLTAGMTASPAAAEPITLGSLFGTGAGEGLAEGAISTPSIEAVTPAIEEAAASNLGLTLVGASAVGNTLGDLTRKPQPQAHGVPLPNASPGGYTPTATRFMNKPKTLGEMLREGRS